MWPFSPDDPRAEDKRIQQRTAAYHPRPDEFTLGSGVRTAAGTRVPTFAEAKNLELQGEADRMAARTNQLSQLQYDPGISDYSRAQQLQAAGAMQGAANRLNVAGDEFLAFGNRGEPASVAEAQESQAYEAAMANALGQGAVGAGATGQQTRAMSAAAGDLASLRAREQDQYRTARLGAYGDAVGAYGDASAVLRDRGQVYGDVRQGDIALQGSQLAFDASRDDAMLGAEEAALAWDRQGFDYLTADQAAKMQAEAIRSGQGAVAAQIAAEERQRQMAADAARRDAYIQAAGEVGSAAYTSYSNSRDSNAEREQRDWETEWSDERLKTDITPHKTAEAFGRIPAYEYEYIDPSDGEGRHVGPMAQDLEAAGFSELIVNTPRGKKVNTSRLALVNTAALSELQREYEDLREKVEALSAVV